MADIKLFRFDEGAVAELPAESVAVEKTLQDLLEKHLESFLGIRLIATEYVTGKKHRGRIDTLGLDENNSPVIIEYKRNLNESVVLQGLFYLDWLMDHRADFKYAAVEQLGSAFTGEIDWSGPRLLCIAGDFTRYDEYAVAQIPRNIELLRYRRYGPDLLLLELVNTRAAESSHGHAQANGSQKEKQKREKQSQDREPVQGQALQDLGQSLNSFLLGLGDDVTLKELEHYNAYRRLKNFACVKALQSALQLWVKLNPSSVELENGFTRDVTNVGHLGTGNLEIRIQTAADLEKAKPLLTRSYEEN